MGMSSVSSSYSLQIVMAASIYATPPPDLIGEDETGLSDSSNSSPLPGNSNNNSSLQSTANGLADKEDTPFDTTRES